MPGTTRRFIVGLALFLAIGVLIGWIYDQPIVGLLVATVIALVWQVRQLLAFERSLHTGDFDQFRTGEGIWQQIFSRFRYERERGNNYKREYRRLLKEIRKSTNAMPDGAVILNDANEIVIANRAAKGLAGLKRKKDRGQRVDNILRDPALTRLLRARDNAMSVDIESPVADGGWLNCRVVAYGANQKLLLLRDVTERMVLSKMRRDFVANASHELRSPLTVISGYLDSIAEDQRVPEDWAEPIRQMQEQSRRMAQIVSELLELSRLERGGSAPADTSIDVAGLLESARSAFDGRPGVPAIVLDIEFSAQLRGDRAEIESIITNLLSNAIRHTPPEGEVRLCWRSSEDGADLVVSDNGEGIAEQDIPRLTERFFRVDRGRARTDGGVGLGLAIVKHALIRHDADLLVTSEVGQGSEFRCQFPRERVEVGPPVPLSDGANT
jgi:two-component system phosphate regulon sensor histidine kinase PhoR